jgi:hypothetical protein
VDGKADGVSLCGDGDTLGGANGALVELNDEGAVVVLNDEGATVPALAMGDIVGVAVDVAGDTEVAADGEADLTGDMVNAVDGEADLMGDKVDVADGEADFTGDNVGVAADGDTDFKGDPVGVAADGDMDFKGDPVGVAADGDTDFKGDPVGVGDGELGFTGGNVGVPGIVGVNDGTSDVAVAGEGDCVVCVLFDRFVSGVGCDGGP